MKIAFLHYHLKTGGVTTVLQQQIKAVSPTCEVMLLTGEMAGSYGRVETRSIPGIGYDINEEIRHDPEETADAVINAIFNCWPGGCDILHVHNPTLAKNRNFLKILKILQIRGITLFLQIHDFAEDGRPQAYFHNETYPADCHYGVINSRDYNILLKCGLKSHGLHRVFNAITPLPGKKQSATADHVLYPVRAIRRKNIGEAILLSLFMPHGVSLKITLPPNSPMDRESYNDWKRFVKIHRLAVGFEAGEKNDFSDLVSRARFLITTSITEGFGFTFLEPWTAGKMLWGRRLPEICRDFEKAGINLDHMYSGIFIPLEWINREAFSIRWKNVFRMVCRRFDFHPRDDDIRQALTAAVAGSRIDFGLLDENFQRQILLRVIKDKQARRELIRINPFLAEPGYIKNPAELIRKNRAVVLDTCGMSGYTDNLMKVYRKIIENPVSHRLDKQLLLRCFLRPDRFSLLKWSDYAR
ncbi:MAG: hypothetical protein B6I22_04650 [Desulfobacteraceae bacterium 4572_123]|nr:MAG: hypothetical protein B6I22_04650 [Desulfobacteraceae bacterium 4572_123]